MKLKKEAKFLSDQFLETKNRIKAHRKQTEFFTADLDLLRKRFDVEKGLFGKAAASYSRLSSWIKLLIVLTIVAVATSIGLIFSVISAVSFSVIAFTAYSALAYIFEDHTRSDENRFKQLSEGLVRREEELKGTLAALQTAENEIFELIQKIKEFGQRNEAAINNYSKQLELLQEKVDRYETVLSEFEALKAALSQYSKDVQSIGTNASVGLEDATASLFGQAEQMKCHASQLEQAIQQIQEHILDLKLISPSGASTKTKALNNPFEKSEEESFEIEKTGLRRGEGLDQESTFLASSAAFILEMSSFLDEYGQSTEVGPAKIKGIVLN